MEVSKPAIYISESSCPYFNLAYENFLLRKVIRNAPLLFFYLNRDSVVLGNFQNPWNEVSYSFIRDKKLPVIRRQSGGGTVFHDLGNLNFSFLYPKGIFPKEFSNGILINALDKLGIEAFVHGKNNLVVEQNGKIRKFSGSAYKQIKKSSLHHGTLLISSNLELVRKSLRDVFPNIVGKHVESVPAHVVNLAELNNDLNIKSVIDSISIEFKKQFEAKIEIKNVTENEWVDELFIQREIKKLKSDDHTFGKTPFFSLQVNSEVVNVEKGQVLNGKYSGRLFKEVSQFL